MSLSPPPPVTAASSAALERLAAASAAGAWLIAADPSDVATDAAVWVAGRLVAGRHVPPEEVFLVEPSEEVWTVEDVRRLLVPRTSTVPGDGRVVVVAAADRMGAGLWDRMLKTVEDAPASLRLVFCATHLSLVPATVRSRAAQQLTAEPLGGGEMAAFLEQAGFDAAAAVRLAPAASRIGVRDGLLEWVAEDEARIAAAEQLFSAAPDGWLGSPAVAAARLAEALGVLTAGLPSRGASRRARRLAGVVVDRVEGELVRISAAEVETVAGWGAAAAALDRCEEARVQLRLNVAVETVFASLLAALSSLAAETAS